MIALLALIVMQPPIAGRPLDFSGAVGGPFAVRWELSAPSVTFGESVDVALTVVGPGNLAELPTPDLSKRPAIAERFAVEPLGVERKPNAFIARYRLRPRSAEMSTLPAWKWVYYQPASRRYMTTYAEAVPLEVRPATPPEPEPEPEALTGPEWLFEWRESEPSPSTGFGGLGVAVVAGGTLLWWFWNRRRRRPAIRALDRVALERARFGPAVLVVATSLLAAVPNDVARDEFARGVAARADARLARPHFQRAAELLADAQSARDCTNLGHARALASDWPRALAAYRRGVETAPHDETLVRALTFARAECQIGHSAMPTPLPLPGRWSSGRPVAVVVQSAELREGNGVAYDVLRPMPAGAEVEYVGERAAWCRVRLNDGMTGWVPTVAVMRCP